LDELKRRCDCVNLSQAQPHDGIADDDMRLIKVICELRYAERMRALAPYEALYREVMGKEPEDADKWITPGLRIEDKERKRLLVVDPARTALDIEQPPNVGYCKDTILAIFEHVQGLLTIPRIARWGLRFAWIHDYPGDFQALLAICKQRLLGAAGFVGRASDIGLFLNYVVDDVKVSVTAGPMMIEQLKSDFLRFEPKDVPPVFLYLDLDTEDVQTPQYSRRRLGQLFDTGHAQAEATAKEVIAFVGV
jgi:hypothetical protein